MGKRRMTAYKPPLCQPIHVSWHDLASLLSSAPRGFQGLVSRARKVVGKITGRGGFCGRLRHRWDYRASVCGPLELLPLETLLQSLALSAGLPALVGVFLGGLFPKTMLCIVYPFSLISFDVNAS